MESSAKAHERKQGNVGKFIYPVRTVGYWVVIAQILLYQYQVYEQPQAWVWFFLAIFFAHPHIAFGIYIYKKQQRKIEFSTLVIDMALIAVVALLLDFSPIYVLPYLVANSATNFATNGFGLLWKGALAFIVTLFISYFFSAQTINTDFNFWTALPSQCYLFFAMHYIGFVSYVKGIKLRKAKQDSEQKNILLQEKADELIALNEEIRQQSEEIGAQRDNILEQHNQLSLSNVALQKAHNNIRDSIYYARRLQNSLLPNTDTLNQIFPKHFVFYSPKDVVSGDFFFAHFCPKRNLRFLAVADCTGHGVPGAFMSLVGQLFLHQLVVESELSSPCQILTLLHTKFRDLLQKNATDHRQQDGMDIGILVFDDQKQTFTFSGAKHNLRYTHKNSPNEVAMVSGDAFSIGEHYAKQSPSFSNKEQKYSAGTRFYMHSDGFTDQFGGNNRRKIGKRKLSELISQSHTMPLETQGQWLEDYYHNWRKEGKEQPIDDVILMLIEI